MTAATSKVNFSGHSPQQVIETLRTFAPLDSRAFLDCYKVVWNHKHNVPRCRCRKGLVCPSKGKHSPRSWSDLAAYPTDEEIERLILEGHTQWAGHLGRLQTVSLDIDPRNGGDKTLDELIAKYGPLPPTLTVQSGGGGYHFDFLAPDWVDVTKGFGGKDGRIGTVIKVGGGGELLAGKHIIVLPPSDHESGNRYRIIDDSPKSPPPDWILQRMDEKRAELSNAKTFRVGSDAAGAPFVPVHLGGDELAKVEKGLNKKSVNQCGQGRCEDNTFSAASFLVVDCGLSIDDALPLLRAWFKRGSHAGDDAFLIKKLEDAKARGGDFNSFLRDSLKPGETKETRFMTGHVFRIKGKFHVWIFGPGASDFRREWLPEHDPANIDLSDIAALGPIPAATDPPTLYDPDDLAGDNRPHWCPTPIKVEQEQIGGNAGAVRNLPCRCHHCPYCGPIVRTHWLTSWDYHIDVWAARNGGEDVPSLWCFHAPREDWKSRVRPYINRKKGKFFRLDRSCRDVFPLLIQLIVCTVKPANTVCEAATPRQVKQRLRTALETMSPKFRKGTFSGGGGWGLLKDRDKKATKWRTIRRLLQSDMTIAKVLDELGADVEHFSGSGRFYPWRALKFVVPGKPMAYVWACLEAGYVLPEGWEQDDTKVTSDGNGTWTFDFRRDTG